MPGFLSRGRYPIGLGWIGALCVAAALSLLAVGCGDGNSTPDGSTKAPVTGAVPKEDTNADPSIDSTPGASARRKAQQPDDQPRSGTEESQGKGEEKTTKRRVSPPAEKQAAADDHVQGSSPQSGQGAQNPKLSQGETEHHREEEDRTSQSSQQPGAGSH